MVVEVVFDNWIGVTKNIMNDTEFGNKITDAPNKVVEMERVKKEAGKIFSQKGLDAVTKFLAEN